MAQNVVENKYLSELVRRVEGSVYYHHLKPVDYTDLFFAIEEYKINPPEGLNELRRFIIPEEQKYFFNRLDNLLKPGVKLKSSAEIFLHSLIDIVRDVDDKIEDDKLSQRAESLLY